MSIWWEERAARLREAADIVATRAECSHDAALLLLKLRAAAVGCDLEEIANEVIEGHVRFTAELPLERRVSEHDDAQAAHGHDDRLRAPHA